MGRCKHNKACNGLTGPTGPRGLTGPLIAGTCPSDYLYWNGSTWTPGGSTVRQACYAGSISQDVQAIAIGNFAGQYTQGSRSVAVGAIAGQTLQGQEAVAVGYRSGAFQQGGGCVAIGAYSGIAQAGTSVAVGGLAGISQSFQCTAIGYEAATSQYNNCTAVGGQAGFHGQYYENSTAIGCSAASMSQGTNTVAVGFSAGFNSQGSGAVSLGVVAADSNQGENAIAVGFGAARETQGSGAIAIGADCAIVQQGSGAIAIGQSAVTDNQTSGSIVVNATGVPISAVAAGTYISPIRTATLSNNSLLMLNGSEVIVSSSTTSAFNKTFVIDHPICKDKYLVHACLEGPEVGVYYRGKSEILENELVCGKVVLLPDYVDKIATNFTIHTMPIDESVLMNTSLVENNRFIVKADKAVKFFWHVYGERKSLEVEPLKRKGIFNSLGPYTWLS